MEHLDGLNAVAVPGEFGQALLSAASFEAVLVRSIDPEADADSPARTGGEKLTSVAIFRIGRACVMEVAEGEGGKGIVGLSPADADEFVDHVRRDDAWTVLSVGNELEPDQRKRVGGEAATGR